MRNKNIPKLSEYEAEEILQEIFLECYVDGSSIPVEQISLYSNYRTEKLTLQRTVAIMLFFLFLVLPMWFIPPKFVIKEIPDEETGRSQYEVDIFNRLPLYSVVVVQDNKILPVYQSGEKSFIVKPIQNGKMTVEVTLHTKQWLRKSIMVDCMDDSPPVLLSTRMENGNLYLVFEDESGIDYPGSYIETAAGEIIQDVDYDKTEGYFIFYQSDLSGNFHVLDLKGNELVITLLNSK